MWDGMNEVDEGGRRGDPGWCRVGRFGRYSVEGEVTRKVFCPII